MTDGTHQHPRWYRAWRRFWDPPDDLLAAAGVSGERVVARIRVFVTGFLLFVPIGQVAGGQATPLASVGLLIAGSAFLLALAFYALAQGEQHRPWLAFLTSLADVTLISATLVIFVTIDAPHTAINSKVVFPTYFLALAATALRYDPRTSVLATLVAVAQYLSIVSYAASHWDLNDPFFAPFPNGMFSWTTQIARIVLLASAGLIATMITVRTKHLRWMSASDPLTHLMNRGFFDERMQEEEIRARRYNRPLAIAMIDIDQFKQFNDAHGHASGDEALRVVSRAIRTCVRRTDLVARYGGEEFVVAFLETSGPSAVEKAEDVRRAVQAQRVLLKGSRGVANVTVSIGVATWPEDGETIRAIIEKADDRLYAAKHSGRNRAAGPAGVVTPPTA